MIIKIEKRYAYAIIGLLVLGIGIFVVNALAPGDTPNPGHNIQSVGPPSECVSGQVLRFIDGSWDCVGLPSSTGDTNANTECSGIYTYLSGEGVCKDVRVDGDLYDTDTHGTCWVSGYANCVWDYAGTYEQLVCSGNKFMRSYDGGGESNPRVYCCDIALSCN